MDVIQLTGIRCYGYTGYLQEERFLGQWFEVDLRIGVDLATAGQSDRIEDTLDYRSVITAVKEIISLSKFDLVEKLAETIIASVLSFDKVQQVEFRQRNDFFDSSNHTAIVQCILNPIALTRRG